MGSYRPGRRSRVEPAAHAALDTDHDTRRLLPPPMPNRLAQEPSPYLLQHANNARLRLVIRPGAAEAFTRATVTRTGRFILSIGLLDLLTGVT